MLKSTQHLQLRAEAPPPPAMSVPQETPSGCQPEEQVQPGLSPGLPGQLSANVGQLSTHRGENLTWGLELCPSHAFFPALLVR